MIGRRHFAEMVSSRKVWQSALTDAKLHAMRGQSAQGLESVTQLVEHLQSVFLLVSTMRMLTL